jgi:hypothetical protein
MSQLDCESSLLFSSSNTGRVDDKEEDEGGGGLALAFKVVVVFKNDIPETRLSIFLFYSGRRQATRQ